MKNLRVYPFLFLVFLGSIIRAQDAYVDSLRLALRDLGLDTTRVHTLNAIATALYSSDPDVAIRYGTEAKELAELIDFPAGQALAYKNIGLGHYFQAEFTEAARNWESSLKIYEELSDDQLVANLLNNLGAIYHSIGNNVEALDLYLRALKMAEELSDSTRIGTLTLNIGVIYSEMPATYDSAVNYYLRAMKLGEAIGDLDIMGLGAMDLGEIYIEKEEYDSALYYFEKSLTLMTSPNYISSALNFIGSIYSEREDFQNAITYQQDALEMARKENAQRETAGALMGLASTYEGMENVGRAIEYYKQAESIAEETGLKEELSGVYEGLATNYAELEDFPNAYKYLELQNTIDNAILKIESDNRTKDLMNNYQMEKKQDEIVLLEQQSEIDDLIKRRQKAISIIVGLFGLFLLASVVGIYNRMRYIRKTNQKINAQKQQITDSITYAQRIQSAILPSQELMASLLPDHFILYRPKDIVSGDFYWIKEVQDHLVIVGADCTGHGVPGAFMSMLGITMFNDLIGDQCFDAPGAILDRLREKVKEMLVQQGNSDEQKDGMDLAICVYNRNNRELHFSGANNPLYIIRKKNHSEANELAPFASIDNGDYSLFELKGDKQPIGTHWEETPFRTTSVYLKEQDSFYMFSDGFIDQFGGEHRKKFKSMNFKKLLLSVQKESMDSQRQSLEQTFDRWRGPYEQIDDIVVLGVKV
ncbi:MAG: tetratricopeptide repeat protein [Bacteroidota bacterium]|nr:tetratricopeptide repeat protein [Bacteroidota bacterium]